MQGGSSVSFHLVSEESWDLFDYAIIESNPFALDLLNVEDATKHGDEFASDAVRCCCC